MMGAGGAAVVTMSAPHPPPPPLLQDPADKTRFFKSLPCAYVWARGPGGGWGEGGHDPLLQVPALCVPRLCVCVRGPDSSLLAAILPKFPDAICKYRILPALMNALEFGAAGALR